jgi:Flp pilus assembly protein TadD
MKLSRRQRNFLICLGLVLATVTVYWPVSHCEFTNYDDDHYVYKNPQVETGLTIQGVVWAFTTRYAGNWHPLTWLSHMLDWQLWAGNAGAHHLVNLLFHLVNTLLLFHVLNQMTAAPWRSGFVAALFALHPLHVESVAWVAERKDVLSTLFWMLTLWAYGRYVERFKVHGSGFKGFYGLALLFFALGLMAKPMLVSLPFVLLLLDFWPLGRARWVKPVLGDQTAVPLSRLLMEKSPFFALTAASCAVTFWAQRLGGTIESLEYLPLGDRIANAVVSYVRYLGKAFWPDGLAVFYPLQRWSSEAALVAVVVLFGVSAWVLWNTRSQPQFVVGWLWYLGTLVPVIGLVQAGSQSMADRYTYLPLIGLFIILAWSLPSRLVEQPMPRTIAAATAVVLLSVCGMLSGLQLRYWQNSVALFEHALAVTEPNFVTHYNLGFALALAGRVEDALEHFKQALQIKPDNADVNYSMGLALVLLGKAPEGVSYWEQALRIKPNDAIRQYDLANVLLKLRRMPQAIEHFQQVLRINPDYIEALNNLAWLLATLAPSDGGDPSRAVTLAKQACDLTSHGMPSYLDTLAAAYAAAGRFDEAIITAQEAIELARVAGQSQMVSAIEAHLRLYRRGQPYRQAAPK